MRVVKTEYSILNGSPIIWEFLRDDTGKQVITRIKDFRPYFYVMVGEEVSDRRIQLSDEYSEEVGGEIVRKVYTRTPHDVAEVRGLYSRSFEADVNFQNRFLIDRVDTIDKTTLRIQYIDIEVDNENGKIPKAAAPEQPINCITVFDSLTQQYNTFAYHPEAEIRTDFGAAGECLHVTNIYNTEKALLNNFLAYFIDNYPDVITAWNSSFDLPYIVARMTSLGYEPNKLSPMGSTYIRDAEKDKNKPAEAVIKGIAIIDMIAAYRKLTIQSGVEESYRLDFIARKVLGRGKEEYTGTLHDLWVNDFEKFVFYNFTDVDLVVEIDRKMQIISFLNDIRSLCFCQLEDTLSASRTLDCYFLRYFHGKKVFPTKEEHERVEYEGAFIGTWAKGLYDWVVCFDVKSMYPSIICSMNMGPDTVCNISEVSKKEEFICLENNAAFAKSPKSYFSEILETLFSERTKYKSLMKNEKFGSEKYEFYDRRQYCIKVLLNATYGQAAFPGSRFYDNRVAESVTYIGRKLNEWSRNVIKEAGYQVLYADTDSCYFTMGEKEIDMKKVFLMLDKLNDSYNDFAKIYGVEKHIFHIEFDKLFKRAFFGTVKKRYAGLCVWKS